MQNEKHRGSDKLHRFFFVVFVFVFVFFYLEGT